MCRDECGLYDNMTPKAAIATREGLTVAIYLTKPPTRTPWAQNQEIHLIKMETAPEDIRKSYVERP